MIKIITTDKAELNLFVSKTSEKIEALRGFFDPDKIKSQLEAVEAELQNPEIWQDHKKLNALNKEKTAYQSKFDEFNELDAKFCDIKDFIEISIELNDEDELKKQEAALLAIDGEIDSLEPKNISQTTCSLRP